MKETMLLTTYCICAAAGGAAMGEASVTALLTRMDGRTETRTYACAEKGNVATLKIAADEIGEGFRRIEFKPSFATAKTGDAGYFLLPEGLQFAFMDDHRYLAPDVTLTTYSQGTRVVVNHGARPYPFEGTIVLPGDWRRLDR